MAGRRRADADTAAATTADPLFEQPKPAPVEQVETRPVRERGPNGSRRIAATEDGVYLYACHDCPEIGSKDLMTAHRATSHLPDPPPDEYGDPEPDPRQRITDAVLSWTVAELLSMAADGATIQALADENAELRKAAEEARQALEDLKRQHAKEEKERKRKAAALASRIEQLT